jgi:hypothetical protein
MPDEVRFKPEEIQLLVHMHGRDTESYAWVAGYHISSQLATELGWSQRELLERQRFLAEWGLLREKSCTDGWQSFQLTGRGDNFVRELEAALLESGHLKEGGKLTRDFLKTVAWPVVLALAIECLKKCLEI